MIEAGRDELLEELEYDIEEYFACGRSNNIVDITLTCFVVVASLAAAGMAAAGVGGNWRWATVVLAALPAALTSIQSRLRIGELSTWYFRYSTSLGSLERELKFAKTPDIEAFAKRRSSIDEEYERLWHELKTRPGVPRPTPENAQPELPPRARRTRLNKAKLQSRAANKQSPP